MFTNKPRRIRNFASFSGKILLFKYIPVSSSESNTWHKIHFFKSHRIKHMRNRENVFLASRTQAEGAASEPQHWPDLVGPVFVGLEIFVGKPVEIRRLTYPRRGQESIQVAHWCVPKYSPDGKVPCNSIIAADCQCGCKMRNPPHRYCLSCR